MSGYVASARIVRSAPRLARSGDDLWRGAKPTSLAPSAQVLDTILGEPVEPDVSDDGRLAAIRDRWAQLTFYLFDANSWR